MTPTPIPNSWQSCSIDGVPTLKCVEFLVERLLAALGGIVFVILLVLFVYGALQWMTAGDDAGKLKKAKGVFTSAVIGLAVISIGYLVLVALEQIFGIKLTTFTISGY